MVCQSRQNNNNCYLAFREHQHLYEHFITSYLGLQMERFNMMLILQISYELSRSIIFFERGTSNGGRNTLTPRGGVLLLSVTYDNRKTYNLIRFSTDIIRRWKALQNQNFLS